ncbi:probable chitinase 10 [Onthophagus taurus]|uniref:probable chitinase 10 n=1 Tax=Onthophagus taurus TaxID=166361 RepID=UPI0039BDAF8B
MKAIEAVLLLLGVIGIGAEPRGTCPSTVNAYVDTLRDSGDCTKFYYCVWGSNVLMTCPDGLHFNTELNICDLPSNARCSIEPTTPPPTTTPAPDCGECSSVTCPVTPGLFPEFFPHPTNCGRYCMCDNYAAVHDMPCPSGLHFNSILNVCDWPSDAGCEPGSTPAPTSGPTTVPDCGRCEGLTCPNVPGQYPIFHPHPEDCGRYCKCDNYGAIHDMPCPDGLHFNPQLNVCDWPEAAGCECGPVTPTTPPTDCTTTPPTDCTTTPPPTDCPTTPPPTDCPTTPPPTDCPTTPPPTDCPTTPPPTDCPTTPPPTDCPTTPPPTDCPPTQPTQAPDCGQCTSVTCPYTPGEIPVFHPHPEECGRYCKCDKYGTVHDMPCPAGLHFNPTLDVCDWPNNAGCDPAAV